MADKGIQAQNFFPHTNILAVADKPAQPPANRIAGPYRKDDGGWYERRSDGTEVKLFGGEVVYKAAAAISDENKVNAYPKLADIGAPPAVTKGSVYSTFTLDTGVLSSYIANEAGTAWVAIASTSTPGVYCGFATKFASLPTTRRDGTVLSDGDLAFLTAEDGANKQGAYRYTGTAWTFDFAFPVSSNIVETLSAGGTPKAGFISVQKDTDTFVAPTLTSGQKATVLQFDSNGSLAKEVNFYHDGTKQFKVNELIAQRWTATKGTLDINAVGADNAIETTWWTTTISLSNAPGGLASSTRGQIWQYFDGNDDGIQQLVIGDSGWSAGEWYRSKSGGTWSGWVRQLVDVWGLSVDNSTYNNGTLIVVRDTHKIKVRYSESGRAFRAFPATDWANIGSITAADAGWTLDGSFPTSGREEVVLVPDSANTKWIISRVGIKSHEDLIAVSKGHLPDASAATAGQIVEVYDDAGTKKYRLGNAATFGEYKGDFDATTTAITTTNITKAGDWIYVTKDGTFDTVALTKGQFLIAKKAAPSGANLTDWLVGVARTDLVTLIQSEIDDAAGTKAGQVTGAIVQKAIDNRLLRKTYANKAARDTDDANVKIGSIVKVDDVWQQKTAAATYEEISRPGIPKQGILTKATALTESGIYGFDGKGDAATAPLEAYPPGDMGTDTFNNPSGWGAFVVGFDPASAYNLLEIGKTVRKVRVRATNGSGHIQQVRLYSNTSATTLEASSAVANMIALGNNVFEYDLVTPIQISSQTEMLAVQLLTTVYTDSRIGFTNLYASGSGAPSLTQNSTKTAIQFMLDGAAVPPLVFTLPSAVAVKTNAPFIFHETSNSNKAGAVLKPISGQTINGAADGTFDMKDASGIYIAVSDGTDGYAVKALGSSNAKAEIPTTQAGLGTAVAIESIKQPNNIHLNSASGAVTWDVKDITDGTWHYITNVATEDVEVTFTNHTKVYLRDGAKDHELTTGKLSTKPGQAFLAHVTNNAGAMYVNIAPLGGSGGLTKHGTQTADKTLKEGGIYSFAGNVPVNLTFDKAATVGKNEVFIFHEIGDSATNKTVLRAAATEKINGSDTDTFILQSASGIWIAISNGVDGFNVSQLNSPLIPTVQAGSGDDVLIEKLETPRNIHLNSASNVTSWDVASTIDGSWHYIFNVATEDVEVVFTNHLKVYLRNGLKENEITDGKLATKPGEAFLVHVTENAGDRYVNIVPFGGGGGLKLNGSLTANKTLTDSGIYAFPGDGVGTPIKTRLEITLPKAATAGKNAPFFFHETSDSQSLGALLRTTAGEKTNGVVNSPYLMRSSSGVWLAISNGVDGYNVVPIADGNLIPTFQAGFGLPAEIEKIDGGAKAVHLNSASGAVSWNVSNSVDGTWRYIMNVAAEDVEVTFTNHFKLYARNGVLNNELTTGKLLTRPGETYFVHLTNNSDNIYVNVVSLGTATGMKRCGVLNADKTLREPGVYAFSGATGAAVTFTLDNAPLVGENQVFVFHEAVDASARAVTLKPKTGDKLNGVVNGTFSLRGASGVWMAICNGVDGYDVMQLGGSLLPTVQAGLGTAVAIDNLDCGRAVHLNSKNGAVTWNVANAIDGTWQYLINTSATDDVDVTFLGHYKIYLRDGIKDNEVTTSQLRVKPGEWYIVHLTNNSGQVFVNIGKMFNRGVGTFTGLQRVGVFTPPANTTYDTLTSVTTGIDFTVCDYIVWTFRLTTDLRAISIMVPVVVGGSTPTMEVCHGSGQISSFIASVADAKLGKLSNVDCHGVAFETIKIEGFAFGENGFVVPTGTTLGETCDVKVNGVSIGKALTGTTSRLTVTPAAGKMIQTVSVPDATQGKAVYADPYTGELSVTPSAQKTTMDITVTYTDINRQSYSFAVFRTDNTTISIGTGSPTFTNARFTVNELSLNTASVIHASGDVIVPRTGRVFVESQWWNSGTGDQRVTLRHKDSTGTTIKDYSNMLSISSNSGYGGVVLYVTKGDRLNWVGAGSAGATSIYWAENSSELRLTSLDDTGKGSVVPTATTERAQITITANAGGLLVNNSSSVPGFTGTSQRVNVVVPSGQFIASVSCANANVTVTAADTLRGAIEVAIATGATGTADISVTFATLGLPKVIATANAGIDVTCGTLRWRLAASGNRSLQVTAVAGTTTNLDVFTCHDSGGKTDGTFSMTTNATATYVMSTWNFGAAGNWMRVKVNDKTNGKWYECTMIIGASFNNNSFEITELP